MKRLHSLGLCCLLCGLLAAGCATAPRVQQWEYRSVHAWRLLDVSSREELSDRVLARIEAGEATIGDPELEQRLDNALNDLGREGWEYVTNMDGLILMRRPY